MLPQPNTNLSVGPITTPPAAALSLGRPQWRSVDTSVVKGPLPYPGSLLGQRSGRTESQTFFLDPARNQLQAPREASNFPQADFWGISVTSGDPLLSRIREVSDVGWRIIGLSSAELVSNSPGLYPSHDETFW